MWEKLALWWLEELADDPTYEEEIAPLALDLLEADRGLLYLDVGCGNGRLMAKLSEQCRVVGCDLSLELLSQAQKFGPVFRSRLPTLDCLRSGVFAGAVISLVLEHLPDECLLQQLRRIVRPGGRLAVVVNHPIWTAPESSPMADPSGEMLWRPGRYFGRGFSDEPAGTQTVRFYHRTMADLLNSAAGAGWDLERVEERGVSQAQVARFPEYEGQENIPRLLGLRWRRRT